MKLAPLTAAELARGWVEYHCPAHGGLVAGPATLTVVCRCRKKAVPHRRGKPAHREALRRLRASH